MKSICIFWMTNAVVGPRISDRLPMRREPKSVLIFTVHFIRLPYRKGATGDRTSYVNRRIAAFNAPKVSPLEMCCKVVN